MTTRAPHSLRKGFTLIEIMIVIGIMAIIVAVALPAFDSYFNKRGMLRAVSDITEACSRARAHAILNGTVSEVVFRPRDGTVSAPAAGFNGIIPEDVTYEALGVNFVDHVDADEAHVRFFPNGTCDEMQLIVKSNDSQVRMLSLEITTGLSEQTVVR